MYDRNVKSERILTKLRVPDYEYICDRNAKFHKKIFITRVINIQSVGTVEITRTDRGASADNILDGR